MAQRVQPVRDGLLVGCIAYLAVAVFYSVFDFLAARGYLYTVNLLGRSVFRGLRDPIVLQYAVQLDMTAIFLYNALHFAVALAIGLVVMWLVSHAERYPARPAGVLLVLVAALVATSLPLGWLTAPIRRVLLGW